MKKKNGHPMREDELEMNVELDASVNAPTPFGELVRLDDDNDDRATEKKRERNI